MLLKILDYLVNREFVSMIEWSKQISTSYSENFNETEINLLKAISNKDLDQVIELLQQQKYITLENESFSLILHQFEENYGEISQQWQFSNNFQDETYLNLIFKDDIIIYSPEVVNLTPFSDLKQFKKLILDPYSLYMGGNIYSPIGLSDIEILQKSLRNTQVNREFQKYAKYEKVIQFIEGLDSYLQQLFSIHQIGIIVFQGDIYLIKWVQFIDEDQLVSGNSKLNKNVTVMEDFGVKIGVQLKQNLELGDLVIFRNKDKIYDNDHSPILKPLLSLDESIFSQSKIQKEVQNLNLSKKEDCKEFVNIVLGRIEMGILLLSKDKSTFIKNKKDLDLYVSITLQRVEGMNSINQRINILRDLLSINQNPEFLPKIRQKLENSYIIFLKEQFQYGNISNIPFTIKIFADLSLFKENIALLCHTIVHLFDTYYSSSQIILDSVELLFKYWQLNQDLIKLLEKPQIISITNIVAEKLNLGEIGSIFPFLRKYIEDHPQFRSYNILTLVIQILVDIFRARQRSQEKTISREIYMLFLRNFLELLRANMKNLEEKDKNDIKSKMEGAFLLLSQDADFIAFLKDKIENFLGLLFNLESSMFSNLIFYKIAENFIQIGPLAMFHHQFDDIGSNLLNFFINNKTSDQLVLSFYTNYVLYFTKSIDILAQKRVFFNKSAEILIKIASQIKGLLVPPLYLLPLKKEIQSLLNTWYLERNLPEHDFEIHKRIIDEWVDFVDYRSKLNEMRNILFIKDFIWALNNHDQEKYHLKFQELPSEIYEYNLSDLIVEMQNVLQIPFENINQFNTFIYVFNLFQEHFQKFQLSQALFRDVIELMINTTITSIKQTISRGKSDKFSEFFSGFGENLIYFPKRFYALLLDEFTQIFEMNIKEGERFLSRIQMISALSIQIENFIQKYSQYYDSKKIFLLSAEQVISSMDLKRYLNQLKEAGYTIFQKTQNWLLQISQTEYLTYDETFDPVKKLFVSIIQQFSIDKEQILLDLKDLSNEIFRNQRMLNDNKKKFFRMMINILPQTEYPGFYPLLSNHRKFIENLSDVESRYYSITTSNVRERGRIEKVKKMTLQLIDEYSQLFSLWFIYANTLAIDEKYEEAINAYLEALKYESNQGNFARLYHNLLVAYLSLGQDDKAIALVQEMDIGLKAYERIKEIIKKIEQKCHITLLEE